MRMQHLKRRHKKMHRSPILKNKRSPKKSAKEPKKRAVSQRMVAHRTALSGVHRTVWWSTGQSVQRGHWQALSGCSTGLSGGAPDSRHWTVRCAPDRRQRLDPTVDCYRRQRSADVACTGHCIVAVQWCTRLSGAPDDRPTASLGIGGYKYHPNRPFSCVGAQATYQGI
jgi:hypothetical protein